MEVSTLRPLLDFRYSTNQHSHSRAYWHEDVQSRRHRFRAMPRLDLLGAPVPDWNPNEPRFKNVVRVEDTPWLSDHKIQDVVVYPASSMLCAVLEAARQLTPSPLEDVGFELSEVRFLRALIVPLNKSGITTNLNLKSRSSCSNGTGAFCYDFSLFSESEDDDTVQHCTGTIGVQNPPQRRKEQQLFRGIPASATAVFKDKDGKEIKPERFYEDWAALGMQWGKFSHH